MPWSLKHACLRQTILLLPLALALSCLALPGIFMPLSEQSGRCSAVVDPDQARSSASSLLPFSMPDYPACHCQPGCLSSFLPSALPRYEIFPHKLRSLARLASASLYPSRSASSAFIFTSKTMSFLCISLPLPHLCSHSLVHFSIFFS